MRKTTLTVLAGAAAMFALAACSGNDDTYSDTASVPGIDTTSGFAVPPTDSSLIMPADSMRMDSMNADSLTDTTITP